MTEETQTPSPEETVDPNQLTINDLAAMKNIIDVASSRGAFKPNEMVVIGQTYNKLTAFLESTQNQGDKK